MAKPTGAVKEAVLREATSYDEKRWLLIYGRATQTPGGKLVADRVRLNRWHQSLRNLAAAGQISNDDLQRDWKEANDQIYKNAERFTAAWWSAIETGNDVFFREVADAVKVIGETASEPVQKYLLEILFFYENCKSIFTITVNGMAGMLQLMFPELKNRDLSDLRREVRRWCKTLGITPARPDNTASARKSLVFRHVHKKEFAKRLPAETVEQLLYAEKERISQREPEE